ncbi:MAG: hypothetical protein LBB53_06695 [Prevotellaceae bacterium]|jgi:hypothetical protein|nr:hypothetical protein [Prevotellaceae bacterium]
MKVTKTAKQVFASTMSVAILAPSCTPLATSVINGNEMPIYRTQKYQDLGELAIPIDIKLSSENARYVNFLQKLASDIIKKPQIAQEFANNPNAYLQKNGFDMNISLDEGMLNLVLALGDNDINQAISQNDLQKFYSLCKEKNLLSLQSDFLKDYSEAEVAQIAQKLGIKPTVLQEQLFWGIAAIAVAVAAIVVVVYVVVYDEVAVDDGGDDEFRRYVNDINPVLSVWALKNKDTMMPILVDTYVEDQVNGVIEMIKKENPKFFNENSEEYVRNMIKINILKL